MADQRDTIAALLVALSFAQALGCVVREQTARDQELRRNAMMAKYGQCVMLPPTFSFTIRRETRGAEPELDSASTDLPDRNTKHLRAAFSEASDALAACAKGGPQSFCRRAGAEPIRRASIQTDRHGDLRHEPELPAIDCWAAGVRPPC